MINNTLTAIHPSFKKRESTSDLGLDLLTNKSKQRSDNDISLDGLNDLGSQITVLIITLVANQNLFQQ